MSKNNKEIQEEFETFYDRLLFLVENIEILKALEKIGRANPDTIIQSQIVFKLLKNTRRITLIDMYSLGTYLQGQESKNCFKILLNDPQLFLDVVKESLEHKPEDTKLIRHFKDERLEIVSELSPTSNVLEPKHIYQYRTKMIKALSKYKDERNQNAHLFEDDFWKKEIKVHSLNEIIDDFNTVVEFFNKTTALLFGRSFAVMSVISYDTNHEVDKIINLSL